MEKFPAGTSPLKRQVAEGESGAELADVNTLSQRLGCETSGLFPYGCVQFTSTSLPLTEREPMMA